MSPLPLSNVPDLGFGGMPESSSMALYKDKLLVYDNISTPLSETYTDEVKDFIGSFPVRINFSVVVFCLEGRIDVECNLSKFSLSQGEIAVFVPGTVGEGINIAPDSKLIVLTLSDDSFAPAGSLRKSLFSHASFARPIKFTIGPDMMWQAVQEYQHLKRALLHSTFLNDDLVAAYMNVLAGYASISLSRNNPVDSAQDKDGGPSSDRLYNNFMDLLSRNYIEHKDVAFYAKACGLSPKYFSRMIYKSSGKRPLDWIKAHVVLNAEAMLRSGDYSVAGVSEALRFSSQPAFNRYFKDETGKSPKEYLR